MNTIMNTKSKLLHSARDLAPACGRDDELRLYLNHGWEEWQGAGEPDPAARSAAGTRGWAPTDLDRPAPRSGRVRWLRRRFFLPAVDQPVYRGDWQAVGGTLRAFLNGQAVADNLRKLALPGRDNLLLFRLEGAGAFLAWPVSLTIRRRIGAPGRLGELSRRFAALPPPAPARIPFLLGPRLIRLRQGVLRIPLRRPVRAVHILGAINPEIAGQCCSVYALRFAADDEDRMFLYQGEHLGTPDEPRDLPGADCFTVQVNLPGCEIDSRVGLYDTVLDNPRPELPVRELVIDKYLYSQSATQTVAAVTLETERGFEPLPLGHYANVPNDLPWPRGLLRLAFAPRRLRRLIADDFQRAFAQCDVIAGPVTTSVAFGFGEKAADPVAMYLADLYTVPGSLAGIPSMSIPCGFGAGPVNGRRPVGLQLMANHFEEAKMLGVAHAFQRATDWHRRVPAGY